MACARRLTAQRDQRGALYLESHESRVQLQDGRPASVAEVPRNDAHRLIEEAMIAANVAAARELERLLKQDGKVVASGTRPVYRVHEPPPSDRLDALEPALRLASVSLPPSPITPPALSDALTRAKAKSSLPGWIWDIPHAAQPRPGALRDPAPRPFRLGAAHLRPLHLAHPPLLGPGSFTASCSAGGRVPMNSTKPAPTSRPPNAVPKARSGWWTTGSSAR